MTLILATILSSGAILAADRRISFGPPGGPFEQGDADKLFSIRSCAVASFGGSPPNTDVPKFIRSHDSPLPAAPPEIAQSLYESIRALPDPGNFGLLVLGVLNGNPHLCEIDSRHGVSSPDVAIGTLVSRGVDVQFSGQSDVQDLVELRRQFRSIFQQVAEQSQDVGPPFDFATLRHGSQIAFVRSDAPDCFNF
ncbi:MAG: hypothetical protein HY306_08620 [Nitrosomonadales bacterium]|nr:hypothetical protein [Nitrosomonadales bacterium]